MFQTKLFKLSFGRIALLALVLGLGLGGGLVYSLYRWVQKELPEVAILKTHFPATIYQGPAKPIKVKLQAHPPSSWVRLDQISKPAMGAVVVSEDWAFFSHEGFDANQLREAIKEDLAERRFSRGASTITMQVVKNVFLSHEKTLYRKAKEFILAVRLDRTVSKRKILETYLNIAEWGEGIFGIGPAARFYFSKEPSQLTAKEGAFLAMLLPSPKRYSQSFRDRKLTRYASKTIDSILSKMLQARYLNEEEHVAAKSSALSFESSPSDESLTPMASEGDEEIETPRELDLSEASGSE